MSEAWQRLKLGLTAAVIESTSHLPCSQAISCPKGAIHTDATVLLSGDLNLDRRLVICHVQKHFHAQKELDVPLELLDGDHRRLSVSHCMCSQAFWYPKWVMQTDCVAWRWLRFGSTAATVESTSHLLCFQVFSYPKWAWNTDGVVWRRLKVGLKVASVSLPVFLSISLSKMRFSNRRGLTATVVGSALNRHLQRYQYCPFLRTYKPLK